MRYEAGTIAHSRRPARAPRRNGGSPWLPPATTSSSSAAAPPAAPWPTGCPPTRPTACWCWRRAAPTTRGTSSSTCRRRCTFPIGSRFYDWKYESEPEPHMNGRRDLPRPRQGARRLQQHQRDDLPARQPAGLRALGRRPGHGRPGTTPTACRTSSGWRTASRPTPTTRSAATTARSSLERGPATQPAVRGVLRGRAAGRLRPHRRRQRLPAGGLRRRSTATSAAAAGCRPRGPTSTR